jgi:predicted RNA-binding Zn ribbon-like protein
VRHGAFGWHVHATSDDAPFARRISVEVGMALVDVIRADETERLKVCAGDDCEDLLIDLSKNRSRKFCGGTCGTRANVAAYRARKASAG